MKTLTQFHLILYFLRFCCMARICTRRILEGLQRLKGKREKGMGLQDIDHVEFQAD